MANTRTPARRPSPTRKPATRASKAEKDQILESGVRMTLGAKVYQIHLGDITPNDVKALRQEAGFSWNYVMQGLTNDPDIDVIAAFIWMRKHMDGDAGSLADVHVDYAEMLTDFEVSKPSKRKPPTGQVTAADPEA